MLSKERLVELYRKCATELPDDVLKSIRGAYAAEGNNMAKKILKTILDNIEIARKESKPICQDTGVPLFYITDDGSIQMNELNKIIEQATDEATDKIPLRPNSYDSISGESCGNKAIIHLELGERFKLKLLMKGGGSENVSKIYSLPDTRIKANRDMEGIRRCVLDAVYNAQGKGCPPYFIGIAVAGTIEEAAGLSKRQLLRDINDNGEFVFFENRLLADINSLNIGPLGLGGNSTALSVKMGKGYRHPASFFVGVSFNCWALRRQSYG